mgnify:CR=1 FL=1
MPRTGRQANVSKESFMTSEKSDQHQDNVSKEAFMTSQKDSNVIKGLTQVQDLMLIAIRRDASITTPELSDLTGITTRNVARNLKTLQELGILERVGGRKKGYWKVNRR